MARDLRPFFLCTLESVYRKRIIILKENNLSKSDNVVPIKVSYGTANTAILSTLSTGRVRKFTREGWNGKNMYVQAHGSIPTGHVKLDNGENAYIEPFLVIVNNDNGRVNVWVPSSSDLQANDWYEVE